MTSDSTGDRVPAALRAVLSDAIGYDRLRGGAVSLAGRAFRSDASWDLDITFGPVSVAGTFWVTRWESVPDAVVRAFADERRPVWDVVEISADQVVVEFGETDTLGDPTHGRVVITGWLTGVDPVVIAPRELVGEAFPLTWSSPFRYVGYTLWLDRPLQWVVDHIGGSRYLVTLVEDDTNPMRETLLYVDLPGVVSVTSVAGGHGVGQELSLSDHDAYAAFCWARTVVVEDRVAGRVVRVTFMRREDLPDAYTPYPPPGWAGYDPERFAHPDANKER